MGRVMKQAKIAISLDQALLDTAITVYIRKSDGGLPPLQLVQYLIYLDPHAMLPLSKKQRKVKTMKKLLIPAIVALVGTAGIITNAEAVTITCPQTSQITSTPSTTGKGYMWHAPGELVHGIGIPLWAGPGAKSVGNFTKATAVSNQIQCWYDFGGPEAGMVATVALPTDPLAHATCKVVSGPNVDCEVDK